MSVVQQQFDANGQPITEEKGNPVLDALGNLVGTAGMMGLGFLGARGLKGLGKGLGKGAKGLGKKTKPAAGLGAKAVSPTSGMSGKKPPRINTTRPPDMSSSIRPPPYPGTPTLPPYSKVAPKVPFGKKPAPPPSMLNKAKSAVKRTIRKITPKSTPKKSTRKPPPPPYKAVTGGPPIKPPRKRHSDKNKPWNALKSSYKVQKSEAKGKGFTGEVFKKGEIKKSAPAYKLSQKRDKPLPAPPKPPRRRPAPPAYSPGGLPPYSLMA